MPNPKIKPRDEILVSKIVNTSVDDARNTLSNIGEFADKPLEVLRDALVHETSRANRTSLRQAILRTAKKIIEARITRVDAEIILQFEGGLDVSDHRDATLIRRFNDELPLTILITDPQTDLENASLGVVATSIGVSAAKAKLRG